MTNSLEGQTIERIELSWEVTPVPETDPNTWNDSLVYADLSLEFYGY